MITLYSMATVLAAEVIDIANQRLCVITLSGAGFNLNDVLVWLPDAQELARELRADEADKISGY